MRVLPILFLANFSAAAAAPNWSAVPAKPISLFTPGQTSLEWLTTPGEHKGADRVRAGSTCLSCHIGQESAMGDAARKKYDRAPLAAQPNALAAIVQVAHDADTLYVRLSFADVADAKMNGAAATVAMIVDDGGTPEAARAGCWAMCHDDSATMPSAKGSARTMYLGKTRTAMTRQGGGDALKPAGELARLKASRYGIEYWQATLGPAPKPANGMVFDARSPTKTVVAAKASRAGNQWTVVLSRKLKAGRVALVPGKKYAVAFAINAGHSSGRYHYVSFERSLVLDGGAADFVAK